MTPGPLDATPPPARLAPLPAERLFVVIAFVLFSGALLPQLRPEGSLDQVAGDPLSQLVWFTIYLGTALFVLRDPVAFLDAARRDVGLLVITGLVLASTHWSYAPDVSFRKSLGFVGSMAFALYVAHRFDLDALLACLRAAMAVVLVGSLVMVVAVPSLGIDHVTHAGAWKGLYAHKNECGRMMVFGTVLFGLALAHGRTPARWAGFLGCAAFILATTSKTALLLCLALGAGVWAAGWLLRAEAALATGLVAGGLVLGATGLAAFVTYADAIATFIGRDLTLTGRTGIWEAVLLNLRDRWWLGYGYEAFWLGEAGDSFYVWRATNYHATFSHNGFLEVWLSIGLVGLGVLVVHLLDGLRRAAALVRREPGPAALFPAFFLAFALAYNLTEAFLLKQNTFFWILYAITTAKLCALAAPGPAAYAPPRSFAPPEAP